MRDFFIDFEDPLEAEELAGLALEETVESRLITVAAEQNYSLRHGPFQDADFLRLPENNWTLLVQAVDQLVPAVAAIKLAFSFLPAWRIDDIMVSHAVPGGGVGPHLDQYDVFLIQGAGKRRWKLGGKGTEDSLESTDSGLKLLRDFKTEQELILECGDVLYIPPGFSHWGVAETAGLCYSVGFRAPSQADLVESFSDLLIDQQSAFNRFEDPEPVAPPLPGEISTASLDSAWQQLRTALDQQALFEQGFGEWVSQPKYPDMMYWPKSTISLQDMQTAGETIRRNPASRFAWSRSRQNPAILCLFVDGEMYRQPAANLEAVISLCDPSIENIWKNARAEQSDAWYSLLCELLNRGSLFLQGSQESI